MDQNGLQLRDTWRARRWACLVGVNYYQDDGINDLRYCVNDAKTLHDLLLSRLEYGYESDRIRLLVSEDPASITRFNILANLTELANKTNNEDLLLFYFAGHGQVINGEAYLLPADANNRLLLDTSISLKRIKEIVQGAAARVKVIILDACHTGVELRNRSAVQESELFIKSVFEEAEGIAILASSTRDELAWEDGEKGHGIFTYYLLEGLAGAANKQADQFITLNEIANYVTQRVKSWANSHNTIQRPTLDFKGVGEVVLLTTADTIIEAIHGQFTNVAGTEYPNPVGEKFPTAIREKKDFYDRRIELKRIKGVLSATTDKPIIIQGERGSGKTSLLNRTKRLLEEEWWSGRQFLYCSVEPSGISSCADFASEMWYGLQNCLQEAGVNFAQALETSFKFDTFSQFAAQLGLLKAQHLNLTYVIYMDEFDKIVHQCDDLEQKRIMGLMRYIVEATDVPIIFFMSILQNLPISYGSPFPADKIILHPFDRADMDEMVRGLLKGHAAITEPSLGWLADHTGGHPFFVKLVLTKLFEAYLLNNEEQIITIEMLQTAAQLAGRSVHADDVLSDIYTTYLNDDERYILLWLASHQDGVLTAREVVEAGAQLSSVFEGLVKRDYLIQQADGSYRLRISFQRDWLRDWPKFEAELERLQVPGQTPPPLASQKYQATGLPAQVVSNGICIDLTTQRVYVAGKEVEDDLTDLEYRALVYLAEHNGQVMAKDEFANYVWGEPYYEGDDQRISQLIHRLRNLLGDKQRPYKYLETLRKRGFRLQYATLARTTTSSSSLKG